MHDQRVFVPLPLLSPRLQHKGVHSGANLSGCQRHLLRDTGGQVQPVHWLGLLVFRVTPEVQRVAREAAPPPAPVAVTVDVGEQGQETSLFDLKQVERGKMC